MESSLLAVARNPHSSTSKKEEGKHKSGAQAKKQTGETENETNTKILGLVDLEQHGGSNLFPKESNTFICVIMHP